MTTSGTSTFNLDLNELVEEAFERCGAELRTGYDLKTARRSLNLLTIEWANRGINLWTIEQGSIPLVQGQITYEPHQRRHIHHDPKQERSRASYPSVDQPSVRCN